MNENDEIPFFSHFEIREKIILSISHIVSDGIEKKKKCEKNA